MKRIGILTAGGDTPALNATLYGAVTQGQPAPHRGLWLYQRVQQSFKSTHAASASQPAFFDDPGTRSFAAVAPSWERSRDYVDNDNHQAIAEISERLHKLIVEGLICVGGDGTLNGMQALVQRIANRAGPENHR